MQGADFDRKKESILHFVYLLMPLSRAYYLAECTTEEIEVLEADEDFQRKVYLKKLLREKETLEAIKDVTDIETIRGISTTARAMLPKMDPAFTTEIDEGLGANAERIVHVYLPDNGRGDTGENGRNA